MILIDKPYVSDFLIETINKFKIPVIDTEISRELIKENGYEIISEEDAVKKFLSKEKTLLYTNSENSIQWIEDKLAFSDLKEQIKVFKNKVLFRELIKEIYPDYFFKEISYSELDTINTRIIKFPVVIKPVVGFFSIAVRRIDNDDEWDTTVNEIKKEVEDFHKVYPDVVLDTKSFIIEEFIEGEEFAVDIYFDEEGKLVILNIMKHLFSSGKDVSDRVYLSSKEIIETYSEKFKPILSEMGKRANLKNFPAHVELRINSDDHINPIEVNPLRYGGFCTTADFAWYAFKTNTYENFFQQKEPNWNEIFKGKENKVFSMIVLDNSTGVLSHKIKSFDHQALKKNFHNILEYRIIDYKKFKVFGFVFAETEKENMQELYKILNSDLKEYITV